MVYESGFCSPRLLSALEALGAELGEVDYVIGLEKNARLVAHITDALAQAAERAPHNGGQRTRVHLPVLSHQVVAASTLRRGQSRATRRQAKPAV